MAPWDRSRPRKFMHLRPEVGVNLYRQIKSAQKPEEAVEAFLEALCSDALGETHIVLKAADQIAVFDVLNSWYPHSKKLFITRDGRDAAISATHFRKLMGEIDAPFRDPSKRGYWDLLQDWTGRVDVLMRYAGQDNLYIVRYEDLTYDFAGTVKPMLVWLGLDHSDAIVQAIQQRASFETLTGRARGTEANSTMRKGVAGEWKQVLTSEEKEKAWQIAGEQLDILGYTLDGRRMPLPNPAAMALKRQREQLKRLEQELARVKTAYSELERWSQELLSTIRTYERWLSPVLWLRRLWGGATHRPRSGKLR